MRPSWSGQQGTWRNGEGSIWEAVARRSQGLKVELRGLDFGSGLWGVGACSDGCELRGHYGSRAVHCTRCRDRL